MPHPTTEAIRFQCRHIFIDGHRCGAACLRGEEFCYYHHTTRLSVSNRDIKARKQRQEVFTIPNPEDRSAIQHAIGEVLRRIASNDIDPRRAGLLLYGLQIASLNLPKFKPTREPAPSVEEITIDPILGPLATPCKVGESEETLGSAGRLLRELELQEEFHPISDLQAEAATTPPKTTPNPHHLISLPSNRGEGAYSADAPPLISESRVPMPFPSSPNRDPGRSIRLHQPSIRPKKSAAQEREVPHSSQLHRNEWGSTMLEPPLAHANLDALLKPADILHIADCDSSPALAVHEVRRRKNLVIWGRLGTGKSQTIAIVSARQWRMARRCRLLSRKMVALDVVKRHLDQTGIGDACPELHSNKANERQSLQELSRTWDRDSPRGEAEDALNSSLLAH